MKEETEYCCKICGRPIYYYEKSVNGICEQCLDENLEVREKAKDTDVIICSNCYEENKNGEKYCYNCGNRLYYNDTTELEEISEDDIVFFDEEKFDNSMKFDKNIVAINKEKQEIQFFYKLKLDKIISFENVVECNIIENSNVMESGGVGRALVGGIIAGGAGAIVGANTRKSKNIVSNLSIRIVTNEVDDPLYNLNLITYQIDTNKPLYANFYKMAMNFANNVYATIQAIINENNKNTNKSKEDLQEQKSSNGLEQLEKLAELKDKGIITDEEFEESKKKILSKL